MRDLPTGEKEMLEMKRAELHEKARKMFSYIFDSNNAEDRAKVVRTEIYTHLETEPVNSLLDENDKEMIKAAIESETIPEEKGEFVSFYLNAIQPLITFRIENSKIYEDRAKEFEDLSAIDQIEKQGFVKLNKRVSYSLGDDQIQLHLAPSFEVKDEIEDLYRDALIRLVEIVKSNPKILRIGGASWLNATNTYGGMKERLGFTISETPKESIEKHFSEETRPVKDAYMSREEFLEKYSEN